MSEEKRIPEVETYMGQHAGQQKRIVFYAQMINEITLKAKAEKNCKKADRIGGAV